ncbi:MAG: hypothetical protein MHM6MM_007201 [Cercozoa sp. M6MM]
MLPVRVCGRVLGRRAKPISAVGRLHALLSMASESTKYDEDLKKEYEACRLMVHQKLALRHETSSNEVVVLMSASFRFREFNEFLQSLSALPRLKLSSFISPISLAHVASSLLVAVQNAESGDDPALVCAVEAAPQFWQLLHLPQLRFPKTQDSMTFAVGGFVDVLLDLDEALSKRLCENEQDAVDRCAVMWLAQSCALRVQLSLSPRSVTMHLYTLLVLWSRLGQLETASPALRLLMMQEAKLVRSMARALLPRGTNLSTFRLEVLRYTNALINDLDELKVMHAAAESKQAASLKHVSTEETQVEEVSTEETQVEEVSTEETQVEEVSTEETHQIEEVSTEEASDEEALFTPYEETMFDETSDEETSDEETLFEETSDEETSFEEASDEDTLAEETSDEETLVEEIQIEETQVGDVSTEEVSNEEVSVDDVSNEEVSQAGETQVEDISVDPE